MGERVRQPPSSDGRPWLSDPRHFLAWQLSAGLDVAVPTGPERRERWCEVFAGDTVPQLI